VTIEARLQADSETPVVEAAVAQIRTPDGSSTFLDLAANGDTFSATYTPTHSGLHSLEVTVSGKTADGSLIDRAAYLTFEAQPGQGEIEQSRASTLVIALAAVAFIIGLILLGRVKRGRKN